MGRKQTTKRPANPAGAAALSAALARAGARLRLRKGERPRREIAGMRLPEHSEASPEFVVSRELAAIVLRHHAHVYERVEEPTTTEGA
jgi:hypothetical protein